MLDPRQAPRLLRRADRCADAQLRGRRPRRPAGPGHPPGLQDRGHLRGRVRRLHPVPLLLLRRGGRGCAARQAVHHHPRLRPQPDRPGHRVRLLLRARLDGAAQGRLRDRDGQLQPGNRLHRLRRLHPAVLRAAHPGGRPRGHRGRGAHRRRMGVFVQLGGQTPLKLAQQLADAGVPILGTSPGGDRPRRAPRRLLPRPRQGRADLAEERHRRVLRRRQEDRRRNRLPGPGPPLLRARRPRHGDRLRRAQPLPLHRQRHRDHPGPPGADRPVPRGRRRDRRRRPLRRHGDVPRRHHGAHRGGRHPLRRLGLRAAARSPWATTCWNGSAPPPWRSPRAWASAA